MAPRTLTSPTTPKLCGWELKILTPFVNRNLALWLMSDTGVVLDEFNNVLSWTDTLSGSGIVATAAGVERFTRTSQGVGGNDSAYMPLSSNIVLGLECSIFYVQTMVAGEVYARFMSHLAEGFAFGVFNGEGYASVTDAGNSMNFDIGGHSYRILELHKQASEWTAFVDGYPSDGNPQVGGIAPFQLDTIGINIEGFSMINPVAEIILFSGVVTGNARWAMRKYLGTRYGVTVANG